MSNIIKFFQIIGEYQLEDQAEQVVSETEVAKLASNQADIDLAAGEERLKQKNKQVAKIIAAANKEAELIKEKALKIATREAEKIQKKAYNKGWTAGEKKGYQEGLNRLKKGASVLEKTLENIKKENDKLSRKLTGEVIDLALKIAGKVINYQLDLNPELINNIVLEMVKSLIDSCQHLVIKVNPRQLAYLSKEQIEINTVDKNIELIGDNTLKKGDCIIENGFGGKDGTLENKLEILKNKLYQEAGYNYDD